MITVIPAIDIIDGKCVRLTKGDYTMKTTYSSDPVEIACGYEKMGFKRLHVVDLDGAKSKHIVNSNTLKQIIRKTSLSVDFGGGIKSVSDIKKAFECGAEYITLGSVAITNRSLFEQALEEYGSEKIILGADVRNRKISLNGWLENSNIDIIDFLKEYVAIGVKNVLCTDISKDGMLSGPSVELYKEIIDSFPQINLIASGGISSVKDLEELAKYNIPSVVIGKAFYEGKITENELRERRML